MTDTAAIRSHIRAFEQQYDYDAGYLDELLDGSPAAFAAFQAVQPLAELRRALPLDAHFVARIATMQGEDCGPCAQLNVRMAVEAGVERTLLELLLERPDALPPSLADVRAHAAGVSAGDVLDMARVERLKGTYGEEGLAELAAVIVGSRMYPTMKRALGRPGHCERVHLDF